LKQTVRTKNIRGLYKCRCIKEYEQGHQPRSNLEKDERDDVREDSKDSLGCSPLFSVYGVNDVTQSDVHADQLAPEYNSSGF
jgi:hypothetical protein